MADIFARIPGTIVAPSIDEYSSYGQKVSGLPKSIGSAFNSRQFPDTLSLGCHKLLRVGDERTRTHNASQNATQRWLRLAQIQVSSYR